MRVSIITVSFNAEETIETTIKSVLSQTYKNIEYIVVDGKSSDHTLDIVKKYKEKITHFISEEDNGIYDAMNKGLSLVSGDIVGILNADDFYVNSDVIQKIVDEFILQECDSVYANLVYVKQNDLNKVVRYYDSSRCTPSQFAYGWMPAHPTFFVKYDIYKRYGFFRTDLKIAADFDLLVRFLHVNKISYSYIDEVLIKMRVGGISTSGFSSKVILNKEILEICKEHGIPTNIFKILSKYPKKILGLIKK